MNKYVTRTVNVDLRLSDAEISTVEKVIASYSQMFETVVRWCRDHESVNRTRIQKDLYHQLREQEPESLSQFASIAIRAGAAAMKSWNSNNRRTKWKLNPHRKAKSVPLDKRLFSIRGSLLTISTTKGSPRIRTSISVPEWFKGRYPNYECQAATLHISRRGKAYLKLICRVPIEPNMSNRSQVVGIDRGLYKIAVTSKGDEYTGATVRSLRRKYRHNRATLQRKGTRSAKRRLRAMSGREKRFTLDTNHVISKQLANDLQVATYVLEDLANIRAGRHNRTMRKWLGQWAFAQLEFMLRYKCEANGIEVVSVDPKYTSQTCNVCGYRDKHNRHKGEFMCRKCGATDNADLNAAKNIRDKYLLSIHKYGAGCNQPPVMDGVPETTSVSLEETETFGNITHVQTPPLVGVVVDIPFILAGREQ